MPPRGKSDGAAHRRGRATSLLDPTSGRSAPLTELLAAAGDPVERDRVASSATLVVRCAAGQRTLDVGDSVQLRPDDLLPTRRPASYQEMRSFIGRACVPSTTGTTSIWFESLNELNHIRDLLITNDVLAMASQPMLVSWALPSGRRFHYPDLFLRCADGRIVVCDVTRAEKLTMPEAIAQFVLMAATATAAGWLYEVRTELPAQRIRNLGHIHACRHADPTDTASWHRAVSAAPFPVQLQVAANRVGGHVPNPIAVLHLIARRRLFIDLDAEITLITSVHAKSIEQQERPWVTKLS